MNRPECHEPRVSLCGLLRVAWPLGVYPCVRVCVCVCVCLWSSSSAADHNLSPCVVNRDRRERSEQEEDFLLTPHLALTFLMIMLPVFLSILREVASFCVCWAFYLFFFFFEDWWDLGGPGRSSTSSQSERDSERTGILVLPCVFRLLYIANILLKNQSSLVEAGVR